MKLSIFGSLIFWSMATHLGAESNLVNRLPVRGATAFVGADFKKYLLTPEHEVYEGETTQFKAWQKIKLVSKPQLNARAILRGFEYNPVDRVREQQIVRLKAALQKPNLNPNLYFPFSIRLAEAYLDKSRDLFVRENKMFDEEYKQYQKQNDEISAKGAAVAGKALKKPILSNKYSKGYLDMAYKTFMNLKTKLPDHPMGDQPLYFLGVIDFDAGRLKQGMTRFLELERRFPNSSFIGESWYLIADYYFDSGDIENAARYYQKIIKIKHPVLGLYARYKLAWCHYNKNNNSESVETFKEVITESRDLTQKDGVQAEKEGSAAMLDEALNDIILPWITSGDFYGITKYMNEIGGSTLKNRAIMKMVNHVVEEGDSEKIKQVLVLYYEAFPQMIEAKEPLLGATQAKIIKYYRARAKLYKEDRLKAVHAVKMFATYLGPQSAWFLAQDQSDFDIQKLIGVGERHLSQIAMELHARAGDKDKSKITGPEREALLREALVYYDLYAECYTGNLENKTGEIKTDEQKKSQKNYWKQLQQNLLMNAYRGEIYYELGNLAMAIQSYQKALVLIKDQNGKIDEFSREVLIHLISSYAQFLKFDDASVDLSAKVQNGVLMDADYSDFFEKAEVYLQASTPQNEVKKQLYFAIAKQYAKLKMWPQALAAYKRIMEVYSTQAPSEEAAKQIMRYYEETENIPELQKFIAYCLNHPYLGQPQFKDELYNTLEASQFKEAKKVEVQGDPTKTAQAYLEVYQQSKNKDSVKGVGHDALYNAIVSLQKTADSAQVLQLQEKFVSAYPSSPLTPEIVKQLAFKYHAQLEFDQAAQSFEKYYQLKKPEKGKEPSDDALAVLYNFLLIRVAQEKSTEVSRWFQQLISDKQINTSLPRYKELMQLFASSAHLIQPKDKLNVFLLGELQNAEVEGFLKMKLKYELCRESHEFAKRKQCLQEIAQNKWDRYYAYRAQLDLNLLTLDEVRKAQLVIPQNIALFKNSLKTFNEKVKSLDSDFKQLSESGDVRIVAEAWLSLAQLYSYYASVLQNINMPAKLPQESQKAFKTSLAPLIEKAQMSAQNHAADCVKKSFELQEYGPILKQCQDFLRQNGGLENLPGLAPAAAAFNAPKVMPMWGTL